jgi:hypothetical protein
MDPLAILSISPILEEAQRNLITIYIIPIVKETIEGWMQLIAILRGW